MTPRQTSAIAGPSHGLLQAGVHQKLHLPQRTTQHSALSQEQTSSSCQNNSSPHSSRSPLYQGNIQPQSIQQISAARFTNPQPNHTAPRHFSADPMHSSLTHTNQLSTPSPAIHSQKPPLSTFQTPQPKPEHQRAVQPQPQINTSCNTARNGCKEVELKK